MAKYEIITPVKGAVLSVATKRLILSVYKPSANSAVTDYLVRNRAFHKKYSQQHKDRYFTVSEQKIFLKSDLHMFNRTEMVPFWITKPDEPDKIIGRISFYSTSTTSSSATASTSSPASTPSGSTGPSSRSIRC